MRETRAKLQKAIEFSKMAHKGQVDKANKDYYDGHIVTVMSNCKTIRQKIIAALHDVVEDTKFTLDDVERESRLPQITENDAKRNQLYTIGDEFVRAELKAFRKKNK